MELTDFTRDNLKKSIKKISQIEKESLMVYSGNFNFYQNFMLKIRLFNLSRMKLCGRILIPENIDESIFEIKNWKINLSNTDLQ